MASATRRMRWPAAATGRFRFIRPARWVAEHWKE
jgi:hypothetical protein